MELRCCLGMLGFSVTLTRAHLKKLSDAPDPLLRPCGHMHCVEWHYLPGLPDARHHGCQGLTSSRLRRRSLTSAGWPGIRC